MSIVQRANSSYWHVDFVAPNGERIRLSTGTTERHAAQEYHDRLKADLWRAARLEEKPARSFDEAALRWLKEKEDKKDRADDLVMIRFWRKHLTMPLHKIRGSRALEIVHTLNVGNARKNKYMALLRAILRRAEKVWEWIDRAPHFTMLPNSGRRIRSLTTDQVKALIRELPEHQRRMVLFALATGLRQGNVLRMTWDRVDLVRRVAYVEADEFKNGESHSVPLNETAAEILRQCKGQHPVRVFTYRGKPIAQANTKAWRAALKRAGIESFRWHDLRHAVASWLVQAGMPPFSVQEFFGWKSPEMVRRYAHLAPPHLASYAVGLDGKIGHIPAT